MYSSIIAGTMKWGSWGAKFSTYQYLHMMEACIEHGYTTIDHADIYGHYTVEAEFGAALSQRPSLRQQMQIITKCGIKMVTPNRAMHQIKSYDTSVAHIVQSVNQSLVNLKTDYIDCLLIHRPDPLMNAVEMAEAFSQLKAAGKVLQFGVSNFAVSQVNLLRRYFPIAVNQIECSITQLAPFLNGQLDQCQELGMVPMAWSPLGGGKIFTEPLEKNSRILAVCQFLAEKYTVSPLVILLSWLMQHPAGILPVLGTTQVDRLVELKPCRKDLLTREEWFILWRASTGVEVP
jgi:predicted oxidoreductase